jgi:hypothetical protein
LVFRLKLTGGSHEALPTGNRKEIHRNLNVFIFKTRAVVSPFPQFFVPSTSI